MDDHPDTITIPTELERADAFIDFTVLASATLLVVWLLERDVPWPAIVPLLIPLGIWTLTSEGAADIPYIGSVAAGLRNAFGLRRAHEWLFVYLHFVEVALLPVWRARLAASWRSFRALTTRWRARLSETMRSTRSLACSWGCRIRWH